jgi:enamine deaminase RidA (YjgF/YER057c/UK114 family)
MSRNIHTAAPPGLAPGPGYSQVVTGTGRMVFVAGQVALDEQGAMVGAADIVLQTEQVFKNLSLALAAAGASFRDVVKVNWFVLDTSQLTAMRQVRDRYVDTANPPASTLVVVKALARPEFLVEIEAAAIVSEG